MALEVTMAEDAQTGGGSGAADPGKDALHALSLARAIDATLRSLIAQVGHALAAQRRALILQASIDQADSSSSSTTSSSTSPEFVEAFTLSPSSSLNRSVPPLLFTKQLKMYAERYDSLVRELKYWITIARDALEAELVKAKSREAEEAALTLRRAEEEEAQARHAREAEAASAASNLESERTADGEEKEEKTQMLQEQEEGRKAEGASHEHQEYMQVDVDEENLERAATTASESKEKQDDVVTAQSDTEKKANAVHVDGDDEDDEDDVPLAGLTTESAGSVKTHDAKAGQESIDLTDDSPPMKKEKLSASTASTSAAASASSAPALSALSPSSAFGGDSSALLASLTGISTSSKPPATNVAASSAANLPTPTMTSTAPSSSSSAAAAAAPAGPNFTNFPWDSLDFSSLGLDLSGASAPEGTSNGNNETAGEKDKSGEGNEETQASNLATTSAAQNAQMGAFDTSSLGGGGSENNGTKRSNDEEGVDKVGMGIGMGMGMDMDMGNDLGMGLDMGMDADNGMGSGGFSDLSMLDFSNFPGLDGSGGGSDGQGGLGSLGTGQQDGSGGGGGSGGNEMLGSIDFSKILETLQQQSAVNQSQNQ